VRARRYFFSAKSWGSGAIPVHIGHDSGVAFVRAGLTGMLLNYTLRRLFWLLPTLVAVVSVAFFMVRVAPGGPFDQERALPPVVRANVDHVYGLDQPVTVQYARYLWALAHGDLGPSLSDRDFTVNQLLAIGLPVSLALGGLALALTLVLGLPIGVGAALKPGSLLDRCAAVMALCAIALPTYVVAPVLALCFGVYLHWLPVGGWEPGRWSDVVLPVVALALPSIASVTRLVRASVTEALRLPHVRTAHAKGLSSGVVLWRHVLPPALRPLLSTLGPTAASLLTGSLVVETVFGLPGMGRFLVQGALNRDYTLVLGKVIVYALLVMIFNCVMDVLQVALDPKLRRGWRQ
jgi:oligopeptide transport system permease protein